MVLRPSGTFLPNSPRVAHALPRVLLPLTPHDYGSNWPSRLVATLGAKSNTKKVTKKAILDVNVKKACETIIEPEAPMALRLQSNLLYVFPPLLKTRLTRDSYGVSKVYNQQWEYLLLDVQSAQTSIRTLFKSARNNQLDLSAGKAQYVFCSSEVCSRSC